MSRRLIAIVAPGGFAAPVHELMVDACTLVHPAAYDPTVASRFGGCVVASVDLMELAPPELPIAVWVDDVDELPRVLDDARVAAILTVREDVARLAGAKHVFLPVAPLRLPDVHPLSPAVRKRLRDARGLPRHAVAVADAAGANSWCGASLAPESLDTALACASVVIVRGDVIRRAMAWGAPIVTDDATAVAVGASDRAEVLVADRDSAETVAAELSDDQTTASELHWRARRFYERHFDTRSAVLELARRLGVLPTGFERVSALLDELGTPNGSPVRTRAYDLVHHSVP